MCQRVHKFDKPVVLCPWCLPQLTQDELFSRETQGSVSSYPGRKRKRTKVQLVARTNVCTDWSVTQEDGGIVDNRLRHD